jgi:hypothetical protein
VREKNALSIEIYRIISRVLLQAFLVPDSLQQWNVFFHSSDFGVPVKRGTVSVGKTIGYDGEVKMKC